MNYVNVLIFEYLEEPAEVEVYAHVGDVDRRLEELTKDYPDAFEMPCGGLEIPGYVNVYLRTPDIQGAA